MRRILRTASASFKLRSFPRYVVSRIPLLVPPSLIYPQVHAVSPVTRFSEFSMTSVHAVIRQHTPATPSTVSKPVTHPISSHDNYLIYCAVSPFRPFRLPPRLRGGCGFSPSTGLAPGCRTSLEYASLRGPYALHASFLSWFPRAMRCDEQLWHMHQTTAFNPKRSFAV